MFQELPMIHIVKESFYVDIDNIVIATDIGQKHCSGNRMVCASIGSESIAVLMELCFTYWFQNLLYALLNDSIFNRRNPQRSHTSIWFGIPTLLTVCG